MKNSNVIAGMLAAGAIFAIVVFTAEMIKADAASGQKTQATLEREIQQCTDEAQIIHEFLANSNKNPENVCNLTLSLSIKFLKKANECGALIKTHACQFDLTGEGAESVKESEARRDLMNDHIKLMQLKCGIQEI